MRPRSGRRDACGALPISRYTRRQVIGGLLIKRTGHRTHAPENVLPVHLDGNRFIHGGIVKGPTVLYGWLALFWMDSGLVAWFSPDDEEFRVVIGETYWGRKVNFVLVFATGINNRIMA